MSNHQIELHIGEHAMRCFARPRGRVALMCVATLATLIALLPLRQIKSTFRINTARDITLRNIPGISLCAALPVASIYIFTQIIRRKNMPRGMTLEEGIVTLFTPDNAMGMHQFPRSELAGAKLISNASLGYDLQVLRRKVMPTIVLRGYHSDDIHGAVTAINSYIVDQRYSGFEVILKDNSQTG